MGLVFAKKDVLATSQASGLLKALADPLRMKVIESLSEGECCVCDLMKKTSLAQSRLSFHLKVLKDSGLITDRQSGRWVYYKLDLEAFQLLEDWIADLKHTCHSAANTSP
ncbi:metalloregulator ArsR/SmtB family transcription factor [Prochlorococcus sp. MIT 1307]|uniref:ArsR/SmtB family transcription factor n=1 Tax=Prochlorococcus sp. MIT 1307 TaxID=3096219 RepID=UPI002A74F67D|nr:metalloregulator ArsR/SmtB family transcription factor [Prochlorococcus sp. MIT 1307]